MRISTKSSTTIHVLLAIAVLSPHQKVTSDLLAGSAGCNPVEIRKIFAGLKKAGIIEVARGTGGATLLRPPEEISLLDIYRAVDSLSIKEWIGVHPNPSGDCMIGRNIAAILDAPYRRIAAAIEAEMAATTLAELLHNLCEADEDIRALYTANPV